jgi:cellulose synthase operon protein C
MLIPVSLRAPAWRAVLAWLVLALAACNSSTPQSLLASGREYSAKGDHKAAVIQYKAVLQLEPRSTDARLLLGEALLAAGDPDGAVLELTKALNDGAPAVAVLPSLSRALVLTGEYKKLVAGYGDMGLDNKAAQAALKSNVATAWGALGDRAKTEAAAAAALAADPEYGPAKILKARLLAGNKQFEEAAKWVDDALARDGKYYEAWLLRGELLDFVKDDTKGADEAYSKAIAINHSYVPAYSALIGLRIRQHDIAGAKALADRLRAAKPNHPYTMLVDAHVAFLDHRPARARELLQTLLRVFPDHQGILILAGAVEGQLGAVAQAEAYFAKVLQLNPGLDIARINLAEIQIRLGQHTKALDTLKPMLTADPPKAGALALAGDAALRLGDASAAERYFLLAAKVDPSNVRMQTAAALTRLWSGDSTAALAELQAISASSKETYADEAMLAARLKRREFEAALAAIDVMDKKNPGAATVSELRGRVHLARGDLPAARRAYEAALKADPGLFAAVTSLADIDVLEHKPEQALQRLQASVTANPKNSSAQLALAALKSRQGAEPADVKAILAEAVSAAPSFAEPRLRLIDYNLRKRFFKDALAASQDALVALPSDPQILDAAGQAQMQAGEIEQATTTFRRLAALLPNSPQPYMRLAEVYLITGRREQAEAALNQALAIDPSLASAQTSLVDILVGTNRRQGALDYINRVKKSKPDQPIGYELEAGYHQRLNNPDGAVAALREGLTKTSSADLASKLYSLLLQNNRMAEAEKFGNAWIAQHPGHASFEYLLSASDIRRGDLKTADQRLKRVLAAFPNNALALNNMAWVQLQLGGPGAVGFAQRAADLLPDRPAILDTLALALASDRQFSAALETQKRALALAPDDNGLHLNLAKIALLSGDKALARQELERLRQLGPAFKAQAEVDKLMQGL